MKLTIILMLITAMQISASVSMHGQVTLKMQNESIRDVFKEIENQSPYRFFYNEAFADLNKRININVDGKDINSTMDELLLASDMAYKVLDNNLVVIAPRKELQQHVVTGRVTDKRELPLPGVTIVVKGTTQGTVTNADGEYSITNIPEDATLQFSFIGMQTLEIEVGNQSTINVEMEVDAIGIEEVIAVGYATAKRVNLTGSFASVTSRELEGIKTTNLVTGLAGQLPGIRVLQRTGEPGVYDTQYNIRGFGSPLIMVDGIETAHSDFVRLNPNDIDQLTIVKDASAAIYGVKAANGVILVTTKRGVSGKPTISYSGGYEIQTLNNRLPVGDAYSYATLLTEHQIFSGVSPDATTFTRDDIEGYKNGTIPSTDWLSLVSRDYTSQQNHNVNMSGGTDRIKYFTSFGVMDEMGIWKSGDLDYQRYNIRSNVTGVITDNLNVEVNLYGMQDERNSLPMAAGNTLFIVMLQQPTDKPYANDNPQYLNDVSVDSNNPIGLTTKEYTGYAKPINKTFQSNFSLNYTVPYIKGLSAKVMFGYYNKEFFNTTWNQKWSMYTYNNLTDTYANTVTKDTPSSLAQDFSTYKMTTKLAQLNYVNSFLGRHNLSANLIFEERYSRSDNMWARKEFAIDLDQFSAGIAENMNITGNNQIETSSQNYIARLNYDFSGKYLFEFGFNYSGSHKFPADSRWGFFPYTSAGWRISEENFFQNALPFITNLKLRASYGVMGDDAASSFQFLTGYNYPSGNYIFGDRVVSGLGFMGMPNHNITWFTAKTRNIGLEFAVKNRLFYGEFDLFQRDRSGLLATRLLSLPGTVGAALPQENLNADRRRGFELVVGHANRSNGFSYDISGNVTYTRGMMTDIERADDANSFLNWRNNQTERYDNIQWGLNYIGQFQSYDEIFNSPIQDGRGNTTLRPGDLKYEDVNGDGIISDLDRVPIGRGVIPDVYFGLRGRASYRQFDINFLFQGAANSNYNYSYLFTNVDNQIGNNRNTMKPFMDRWHHEDLFDVNSPLVPGKYPMIGARSDSWNTQNSQFWSVDSKYLRLKSLEIGYTVPIKRAGIERLRVYVSGFNLLTWTAVEYVDPEQSSGWWNAAYPLPKIYNTGLNITF